jgi:hypothetical protein
MQTATVLKKTVILTESAGGEAYGAAHGKAVRAMLVFEPRESGYAAILNTYNLKSLSDGEYVLGMSCGGAPLQRFTLGKSGGISATYRLQDVDLSGKLSAVLAHKTAVGTKPVLFGANFPKTAAAVAAVSQTLTAKPPVPAAVPPAPVVPVPAVPPSAPVAPMPPSGMPVYAPVVPPAPAYKDERVAEANVYPDDIELAAAEAAAALRDVAARRAAPQEAPKPFAAPGKARYYKSVQAHIQELLARHPAERALEEELAGTRWARIPYAEGQFYVVGLIGEGPEYIAYGVPGRYSLNPPRELKNVTWLPLRADAPEGEGYWMLYQDADSGEQVDLNIL